MHACPSGVQCIRQVELQRTMFQEYQRREEQRKVRCCVVVVPKNNNLVGISPKRSLRLTDILLLTLVGLCA